MLIAAVPVQVLIFPPADATGCVPHVMVLVAVALVHAPVAVNVRVAVKLPEAVDGVKTAAAGFASWVNVPNPAPPLHVAAL